MFAPSWQALGGAAAGLFLAGGYTLVRLGLQEICKRIRSEKDRKQTVHHDDLRVLATSSNFQLRRSAIRLLLEKAVEDDQFEEIISACQSDNDQLKLKGVTVLNLLVRHGKGISHLNVALKDILPVLCNCLCDSMSRSWGDQRTQFSVQRTVSSALFDLIGDDESNRRYLVGYAGLLSVIVDLLQESVDREVIQWLILIIHQLTMSANFCPLLLATADLLPSLARAADFTQGDVILTRFCLQSIVNLLAKNETSIHLLRSISNVSCLLFVTVSSLRSDDGELIYWALCLLHELVMKDIQRKAAREIPGLIRTLNIVLSNHDSQYQKLVLRILSVLAVKNANFKNKLLASAGVLKRLPVCLASGDDELCHWAVILVHDLLMIGQDAVAQILKVADVVKPIVPIVRSPNVSTVKLVAETLGFLCSTDKCHAMVLEAGVTDALVYLMSVNDSDLQYWSVALLLTLVMTSDDAKLETVYSGGIQKVIDVLNQSSGNGPMEAVAMKVLVMTGMLDKVIKVVISSAAPHHGDNAAIVIDGVDVSLHEKGFNIVVVDSNTMCAELRDSFNPVDNDKEIEDMARVFESIDDEARVFIAVRPHATTGLSGAAMSQLSDTFKEFRDLSPGESLIAYVHKGVHAQVYRSLHEPLHLEIDVNLGAVLNERVQHHVIHDIIRCLTSDCDEIKSGLQGMDGLNILCRSISHQQYILSCPSLLPFLVKCVRDMMNEETMQAGTAVVVKGIAACRLLCTLSYNDELRRHMLHKGVVTLLSSLVIQLTERLHVRHESVTDNYHWDHHRCSEPLISAVLRSDSPSISASHSVPPDLSGAIPVPSVRSVASRNSTSRDRDGLMAQQSLVSFDGYADSAAATVGSATGRCSEMSNSRQETSADCIEVMTVALALLVEKILVTDHTGDDQEACYELRASTVTSHLSEALDDSPEDLYGEDEDRTVIQNALQSCVLMLTSCCKLPFCDRPYFVASGGLHTLWAVSLHAECSNIARMAVNQALTDLAIPNETIEDDVDWMELSEEPDSNMIVSADRLKLRNEYWTFESIKTNHPVLIGPALSDYMPHVCVDGWFYEVTLCSSKVMQIGWANSSCLFHPQKGLGVGDDMNSYAYDGARCRKWNGPILSLQGGPYGYEWEEGDVVSCLLYSTGAITYWLNGEDLEIAFTGLAVNEAWYPALSLSSEQECVVNLGDSPFRYDPPSGVYPVSAAVRMQPLHELEVPKELNFSLKKDGATCPFPLIYFEVQFKRITQEVIEIGYQFVEGETVTVKLCSDARNPALSVDLAMQLEVSGRTIGCGIAAVSSTSSSLVLFLTVNGHWTGYVYEMLKTLEHPVIPCFTCSRCCANFGQDSFLYKPANEAKARFIGLVCDWAEALQSSVTETD